MSKIEWTEKTWNPIVGCSKVSAGCEHCYAETMACRLAHMGNRAYQDVTEGDADNWFRRWNGKTVFVEKRLKEPLKRKKPTMYFVGSMTDIFHETVDPVWVHKVWDIMKACPQHTFQVLTKRPERMLEIISMIYRKEALGAAMGFWRHVWLGVTVENQEQADKRIPILLDIPAAVRFVSVEPMLGPVVLDRIQIEDCYLNALTGEFSDYCGDPEESPRINWVICGGESSHNARLMHPAWPRSLLDQCVAAGVPFFFKQWGEWLHDSQIADARAEFEWDYLAHCHSRLCPIRHDQERIYLVGKKNGGRLLDGQIWDEMPA